MTMRQPRGIGSELPACPQLEVELTVTASAMRAAIKTLRFKGSFPSK